MFHGTERISVMPLCMMTYRDLPLIPGTPSMDRIPCNPNSNRAPKAVHRILHMLRLGSSRAALFYDSVNLILESHRNRILAKQILTFFTILHTSILDYVNHNNSTRQLMPRRYDFQIRCIMIIVGVRLTFWSIDRSVLLSIRSLELLP